MYDPDLLDKINILWEHYPHLRLGQLLHSVEVISFSGSMFTIEDTAFESALDELIESRVNKELP